MNRKRLMRRLASGAVQNVAFGDFAGLVRCCGFSLIRTSGSHHVFAHHRIRELINLQNVAGEAKPYQIRQFLRLVERYNLEMEDES